MSYTALIIEPRKHKALKFVLSNFVSNLDLNWKFLIFHGTENKDFVLDIIVRFDKKDQDRIELINLQVENLTIEDYNNLLYTKSFYDYIKTEMFLIFQTDTMICPSQKDRINEYFDYDYVGAPWEYTDKPTGGNGGLSLRRKSKMIEILDKCFDNRINQPEDVFFSVLSQDKVDIKLPNFDHASRFSIEKVYNGPSFGMHKCWYRYGNSQNILWHRQIHDFCPEILTLMFHNDP